MANGHIFVCNVVGHIELKFKNRRIMCKTMVFTGYNKALLATIEL